MIASPSELGSVKLVSELDNDAAILEDDELTPEEVAKKLL